MSDLSRKSIDWQTSGKVLLTLSARTLRCLPCVLYDGDGGREGGMQMSCPVRVRVSCQKTFHPGMSQVET